MRLRGEQYFAFVSVEKCTVETVFLGQEENSIRSMRRHSVDSEVVRDSVDYLLSCLLQRGAGISFEITSVVDRIISGRGP